MLSNKYGIRDYGRSPLIRTDEDSQTPDADGDFQNAPIFKFNDDKLKFNTNWFNNANTNYGSASGFAPSVGGLPKCPISRKNVL